MTQGPVLRPAYSAAERRSDAVVHLAGLAAVTASVPVLIVLAALSHGDLATMAGVSVYAVTLVLMIAASALYNVAGPGRWHGLLRRLDHSAIYLKIAGTYTPFAALTGQGLALIAGLWCAALAGTGLKIAAPHRFRAFGIALYLGMGWAGLVAGWPLFAALAPATVALIVTGGVIYTLGVGFFLFDRLPFHYTIWHVFVLAATMVLYAAVIVQVVA
jgi:hemolysin III